MTAMAWFRAFAFLLVSLLLAPTVCGHIGFWLRRRQVSRSRHKAGGGIPNVKGRKLQVIACGFPRTGTASLASALGILGFPCFHGYDLVKPSNATLFIKALSTGNPKYLEELLDGYAAVSDVPAACAYKQLMNMFPTAKTILNIRDPNKWYDSFSRTLLRVTNRKEHHAIFRLIPQPWIADCVKVFYKHLLNGKPEDRENCIQACLQHTRDVKEHVPPHKLLVYDFEKDNGWPKLCEFLEVPIPESVFPKLNDQKTFIAMMDDLVAKTYTRVLCVYVALISCIFVRLLY